MWYLILRQLIFCMIQITFISLLFWQLFHNVRNDLFFNFCLLTNLLDDIFLSNDFDSIQKSPNIWEKLIEIWKNWMMNDIYNYLFKQSNSFNLWTFWWNMKYFKNIKPINCQSKFHKYICLKWWIMFIISQI